MDVRYLREQTREEHEATESALPLTAPGLDVEGYTTALRAMLPIVEGWEIWAAAEAPARVRPLLLQRRRSHLLRQDLEALGAAAMPLQRGEGPVDWEAVVRGADAEGRSSAEGFEAGFMGAFYVMEGSTLGGRFIARHVEAVLGLQPGRGNAYFQGHGEATGSVWRETIAAIAAVPEEESGRVVAAAKRTFAAFGAALRVSRGTFAGVSDS